MQTLFLSTASLSCLVLAFGASEVRADMSTAADIALLKAQLRHLEAKVDAQERDKKQAARDAAPQKRVATAPAGGTAVAAKAVENQVYRDGPTPLFVACPEKSICYKGLTFAAGGFLALETVTRQHNLSADVVSPFGAIPFRQTRSGRLGEFRFSARQSRISGLVEGNPDPFTRIGA